ncbi:putative multi antimicrobial extrusion protein [Arabidopsis thaliana]
MEVETEKVDKEITTTVSPAVMIGNSHTQSVKEEVKKQFWLSAPLIGVSLLQYSLQVISVMFVGHLGSLPLSAASIATSFASVTGFTFLMGTASALETLCGQSYGAKMYGKLGIFMQRAMFVLLILSVPLSIVWFYTEDILVLVHQNKSIARLAGSYARYMIPSIYAYALLQCLNRFLQTQNNVFPVFVSSGITTCLHLLLCWVFVLKSGLGHRGAALAISVSYWVNVILLSCYVKFSASCSQTWTGFSKEALSHIPAFLKLGFPSAVMVCLELWSFELLVLLSGLLPNPVLETSTLSICLNTSLTVWMIPVGLGGTASTRISNELGAGNPKGAKLAVRVVIATVVVEGIMIGSVLLAIRNKLGYAFSSDPKVIKYVASMIPIVAAGNFLDGFQCVLSGVARGCGWQKIGACVNLGSYYLVGVPLGLLLGFHLHFGGRGLWLGIVSALVVQVLSLSIITLVTNWDKEAKKAENRVGHSDKEVTEAEESKNFGGNFFFEIFWWEIYFGIF